VALKMDFQPYVLNVIGINREEKNDVERNRNNEDSITLRKPARNMNEKGKSIRKEGMITGICGVMA